jgi:RND family efflux transporter MFP subunit
MKKVLKIVLILGIIGSGVGIYYYLKATESYPEKKKKGQIAMVVATVAAPESKDRVSVTAMGTVVPARSVTVFPEVTGKIIYQNPGLVPGGRFKKGEALVRIDPRDYDFALKQQQARVVQAKAELAREKGLKSVAEREWKMIRDEVQPTAEGMKLALREIQMENAHAMVASAESGVDQAQLRRNRTLLTAPFNALVTEEFVDVGQVVSNASRIATLVDSDKFWVRVSVPLDRLSWIAIPGINASQGSLVKIVQQAGPDFKVERQGQVVKLLGDLDPRGKMARLIVEVDNPMNTSGSNGSSMPLLLGAYVTVHIEGPNVEGVLQLPRQALRDKNQVWVKSDKQLSIRQVEVVWTKNETVFVRGDLQPGDQVITSRIAVPVKGMKIRSADDPPEPETKEPEASDPEKK